MNSVKLTEIIECMKKYYEAHKDDNNTKEFLMHRITGNASKNPKIA